MAGRAFRPILWTIAALLVAGAAGAQTDERDNSGWYGGVQVGAVITGDVVDESGTWFSGDDPYSYDTSLSTHPGFGAGAFAGYKIPFGFRFEFELTYRRNGFDELSDYSEFWSTDDQRAIDGDISSLSYMGNVWYEHDFGAGWMPYVGFGLGAATKFLDCGSDDCLGLDRRADGETDFAFQLGAGLAYALTSKMVVSLDYRYFDSIEVDFDIFNVLEDFDYANHNIALGFRRHF